MAPQTLHGLFVRSAERWPDRVAAEEALGGSILYEELDQLSDSVRDHLQQAGVGRGDRVGVQLPKSIDSLATIYGVLKCGAAYVPVDVGFPVERAALIFADCRVSVVVTEKSILEPLTSALAKHRHSPIFLALDGVGGGRPLRSALEGPAPEVGETMEGADDDLAYILYTSGSTGVPKGVMLSHRNALSFIDWCSEAFEPTPLDRFSSHAPFHFDLSILDIFVPMKHGARVVLFGERLGKNPADMARVISETGITVWYSTPSILGLLLQYGKLEEHDYSQLRLVLFAGEVFAVGKLRELVGRIPHPRYMNLYGPTETNVCTFHEIPPEIPLDRVTPYPIGRVCSGAQAIVVDEAGNEVVKGEKGALCISGPGVMLGYWELRDRTASVIFERQSVRWYRTGDLVVEHQDGVFQFIGRRDRMVKRRGYRIELGEIEAGLHQHPEIDEVAVIALPDEQAGVVIEAVLNCAGGKKLSTIQLKGFCARVLPKYMMPDRFSFVSQLPRTSTDKIDYQSLSGQL
jgi:amino acid adenylation domain-containing protein